MTDDLRLNNEECPFIFDPSQFKPYELLRAAQQIKYPTSDGRFV